MNESSMIVSKMNSFNTNNSLFSSKNTNPISKFFFDLKSLSSTLQKNYKELKANLETSALNSSQKTKNATSMSDTFQKLNIEIAELEELSSHCSSLISQIGNPNDHSCSFFEDWNKNCNEIYKANEFMKIKLQRALNLSQGTKNGQDSYLPNGNSNFPVHQVSQINLDDFEETEFPSELINEENLEEEMELSGEVQSSFGSYNSPPPSNQTKHVFSSPATPKTPNFSHCGISSTALELINSASKNSKGLINPPSPKSPQLSDYLPTTPKVLLEHPAITTPSKDKSLKKVNLDLQSPSPSIPLKIQSFPIPSSNQQNLENKENFSFNLNESFLKDSKNEEEELISPSPFNPSKSTNLFPLMKKINLADMDLLPSYLKTQISANHLNQVIESLNEYVTDKRFQSSQTDFVTEKELRETLQLGSKAKAILLILIQLKRMKTVRRGEQTVFVLCE